jgi:hypothetical protein
MTHQYLQYIKLYDHQNTLIHIFDDTACSVAYIAVNDGIISEKYVEYIRKLCKIKEHVVTRYDLEFTYTDRQNSKKLCPDNKYRGLDFNPGPEQ